MALRRGTLIPLVAILGCAASRAADWYVGPQGDDKATGSKREPWRTLQRAVRRGSGVGPGDTVNLLGGVYRERVTVHVGGRGTSWRDARLVTVHPAPGHEGEVTFKGVRRAVLPWRRWKGGVFVLDGVRSGDHRFLLQGLTREAEPPERPPQVGPGLRLAPDRAMLLVPLRKQEAGYWLKRKDYGPDTLRPGEAFRDGSRVFVHFLGLNGRPPEPRHYEVQTPFFCPLAFAPGVAFVRVTGIRFALYASSIVSLAQNTGVHHVQLDGCQFLWNQSRSIDLHETGEHGSLHLRVVGNRFRFMNQEAIQLGADHCLIRGNEFDHAMDPRWRIRRDSGVAVRVIGNFNVVEHNYIHDYFPINGRAVAAIDLEAGNPLPLNPSHTVVRYNVIENPRPDVQDVRAISLSIQHDCVRNRFHHNLILSPGMGIRLIAPKRENCFVHNTILGATREGIFFFGLDEPLGEYHNMQIFNSGRSPEANVFQNNVVVQANGRDFEHLFALQKGYRRTREPGRNLFLANHWSTPKTSIGDRTTAGDPKLLGGHAPSADSPLVDTGSPLTHATRAGTGTSVPVADSRFFTDGHGIAEPDLVRVGDNEPQPVVHVDGATHTLHFARPLKWPKGAPVGFPWSGAGPDRGAIERGLPWPHLEWLPEGGPPRRGAR